MRFSSFFALLVVNGGAFAQLNFNDWRAPGPKDVRGPCPAMNSLANHGFFPHDGRNITGPMMVDVLGKVFNLSPEMATIVGSIGLATRAPDATFLDLPDLNKHNAFEHDASLSRVDFYHSGTAGVAKFDKPTFSRFFSHFKGMKYITREAAAAARYAMVQYSRKNTPGFTYESQHRITSYAETIKYMKTMVDETGQCRADFVKILFEQERLPHKEGWRPPKDQVTGFVMAQEVMELALATPEKTIWWGEGKPPGNQTSWDIPQCKGGPRRVMF